MDTGYRSLADQVRAWPDERLSRLLVARPDLATPAPLDSAQLAARAATRSSLVRALDGLDRLELSVLDALISAGQTSAEQLADNLAAEPAAARAALGRLLDLALAWESTGGLRAVTGLAELALVAPEVSLDGPADGPPALATSVRDATLVDRAAAGAAFEAVRRVELLLDGWGAAPPVALRSGGLGVRDLKAAAARLHVDEPTAALLIEVAATAGLLATGPDDNGNLGWLPTVAFDGWVAQPLAERWTVLARAWLGSNRTPALVGQRDTAGKAWNALVPELVSPNVAETRRMTLAAMGSLPAGEVLAAGTGGPSVLAHLEWLRPRRPRSRAAEIAWTFTESAALGVTALGGLASYARALLDEEDPTAALGALLPEPVDHILLQADLTAVAPGPLEASLARRLGVVAEVESRGGATVYRFTPTSIRRAMDLGWSAVELHDFVSDISRTPVPQPLTYLIDDTARTFGVVRIGFAEAFLRADDEHALTELLHHPAAAEMGLRRLAPTVLVSTTPLDVLLPQLREAGVAAVVEASDGSLHVARPDAQRARTPRRTPDGVGAARDAARVAAVVTAVRAGDQAAATRPASAVETLTPIGSLAALREAIDARVSVVIGYVDNHGTRSERLVEPLSVDGGQLRAHDRRADEVRLFAVHRISSVRPA
ncbi:helicase C-terminal domain-containing protein [Nocardioides sp. BP30]|uniref:helicase C-terminal domain-containing protein n=1 Tax=Nocardioides sp. BP30 TaxID=3036374 RepID=UPI002469704F|nr:helicase C-terminal domain-containing protein [Nocardioides sp. BP30]WGL53168.1 helicase C-terminal domain-containing protein [Nocardioides sp. BP30]